MRLFAAVSAAGLITLASAAQDQRPAPPRQAPPVFRGGVDLVQVDVVVLDADAQPVRGLTKDDFALFDRGIKQEIATFAAKTHERPPADPFATPLPADVADNQSAKSDRLVIIILDDLHFRGRTGEAVALVERTVNELGDSVSLGLVTTSGTFGIEVTEDRARLLAAVKYFLDRFDPSRLKIPQVTSGPPDFFRAPPGTELEPGAELFFRYSGEDLASAFSPLHAYKTVEDVARMAGANDGRRKAFVWISAGVEGSGSLDECRFWRASGGGGAIDQRICAMYEKLFRSNVAVYAVSPGGPLDGAGGFALTNIAAETGGFFIPASDIDEGMTRLVADLDNYYLLGFYPAEPGRAGYRNLDVVANCSGCTVHHRTGYHSAGPAPPPKNSGPLEALVAPISPKADLHLRVNAVPFFTNGSSMQLLTTIEVNLGELPAAAANGLVRDSLEFAVFAVDLRKKKVTRSVGRRVLLDWPPEDRTRPGAERFLLQTVLNVPPGAYQLRVSTLSKTPEKSGSVYLQVDVPPRSDVRPIQLSGILVGSGSPTSPRVVESKPLAGLTVPFAPSLGREFRRGDELRVFFQVSRRDSKTPVEGFATLVDVDGVTAARLPWRVEPKAATAVSLALPLLSVAPGPYRLVISGAGGPVDAVRREVRIRVSPG